MLPHEFHKNEGNPFTNLNATVGVLCRQTETNIERSQGNVESLVTSDADENKRN